MTLVRMAISCYGKVKMVPGYLKHPSVEWIGDDQIECYSTSDGHIIIETHRNKVKVDEARREIPGLEKELQYNISQVNKINNELKEGRLGRSGDKEKFEAKVSEIRNEIKLRNDIVDTAVTDVIKFDIEDCD